MIKVTDKIFIEESDIREEFIRSTGPGGQNVNKLATAVQLRYDLRGGRLPDEVKSRLYRLAGNKITEEGVLIITARRFRRQEANREDALEKLIEIVRKASERPKARIKTKATFSSKEKRLKEKTLHGRAKKMRGKVKGEE